MLNRRSFLGRASAALVAAPLISAALSDRAFAATGTLPMTIVNNSGSYANGQINFYVVGTDLGSGKQAYMAPDGTLTPVSLSLNGSDGFADLSVPLAGSGNTNFSLPANMSGRVYFSMGDKLKFKVVTDGNGNAALQYPAGWVSGDPSYNVLHDFFEFTHNDSGMFCNSTMVDQFAIPLAVNLVGAQNQTVGQLKDGGRNAIFQAVAAQTDFSGLIVPNNLRIIAPGHGIDTGVFAATYYDSYVDQVWSQYASSTLTVNTGTATYTGQVSGDQFTFSGGVAPFSKPKTLDIFYCNGALAAPNDGVTGPVAAILAAGFNRSTLLTQSTQPGTDAGTFYQNAPTNYYSKAIHDQMVDGKAYGFPFDDVAGFASYVQDNAPTQCTLTLTAF
ncbi:MAG TPA: beta-1,3-glucanase family protein [Pseudonocardiaceae bacterium]|nr:beta-1,3-glucanase family protein [Pseudonocardiaceae bacterium]